MQRKKMFAVVPLCCCAACWRFCWQFRRLPMADIMAAVTEADTAADTMPRRSRPAVIEGVRFQARTAIPAPIIRVRSVQETATRFALWRAARRLAVTCMTA